MAHIYRDDLIYPDLSYRIVGILMEVNDALGAGHRERYYEDAVEEGFKREGIKYKRQLYMPVVFSGKHIGKYYLDFLVEDKIVIELKRGDMFAKKNIEQVYNYLRVHNLSLSILAQFSSQGLKFKRILNTT
ncbi:MAG: GxxExxY protein [Patescibacteria group bacterium]